MIEAIQLEVLELSREIFPPCIKIDMGNEEMIHGLKSRGHCYELKGTGNKIYLMDDQISFIKIIEAIIRQHEMSQNHREYIRYQT